ncbi:MAG: glycosyltransferase family 9 protein [Pseudomonadota bacterium]
MAEQEKILVIKLGALGDFIIALGAMKTIREHHPKAHITILTTKAFKEFAQKSDYFEDIWVDERLKLLQPLKWFDLRQKLNSRKFTRVYDLQNNDRTSIYFKLFSPKPEWIGTAKGASHYYDDPARTAGLAIDGLRLLLKHAGLPYINIDTMDWVETNLSKYNLKKPYALVVPGSAPSRPEKRWPKEKYATLCQMLAAQNIQPVLIGTKDEKEITDYIASECDEALDLNSQTSLFDIITLGRNAKYAVGNDTGPMHMIAPTGCACLTLFSSYSNATLSAPNGENAECLQVDDFNNLNPKEVFSKLIN